MGCCGGGGGGGSTSTQYVQSPEERQLLQRLMPTLKSIYPAKGRPKGEDLYDIPELKYDAPEFKEADVSKYIAGGETYDNVYNQISPSLWNAYNQNVENPLTNRFAGSGSLGSPVGGVSGAAMDVLENSRRKAGNDIASNAYQLAQAPLTQAMQAENTGLLAKFNADADARKTQSLMPWQAEIQKLQYPYQILPGLAGGTMPQPVTTTSAPSSGGCCG